jgi:Mg/Co/Ni transporter MgtE
MSLAKVIVPDIEELIRENPAQIPAAMAELHPADIAELLDELPQDERLILFEALPPEQGAAVLSELKGKTLRLICIAPRPRSSGPSSIACPAMKSRSCSSA